MVASGLEKLNRLSGRGFWLYGLRLGANRVEARFFWDLRSSPKSVALPTKPPTG